MRPHYTEQWLKDYQDVAAKHAVRCGGVGTRRDGVSSSCTPNASSARQGKDRGGNGQAGSNPATSPSSHPQFRSKLEANFASKLELEQRAGLIIQFWYEPFSLWLPGKVRFKPDFLIQHRLPLDDNDIRMLEVIEVKGWSKNRRDGMTRLKMAAALFPCFRWALVTRDQGNWKERTIR